VVSGVCLCPVGKREGRDGDCETGARPDGFEGTYTWPRFRQMPGRAGMRVPSLPVPALTWAVPGGPSEFSSQHSPQHRHGERLPGLALIAPATFLRGSTLMSRLMVNGTSSSASSFDRPCIVRVCSFSEK
jgi:hypothetical protein